MANATSTASRSSSSGNSVGQAQPSFEEVRIQLQRMLAHAEFNASARNRRFLSYVVEETLQGRANRIKAYAIALAVFDRGDDFDPLTDPIVRIEASRLRRAIEHYYLTAGKSDSIRVDMPKGSYIPSFSKSPCGIQEPLVIQNTVPDQDGDGNAIDSVHGASNEIARLSRRSRMVSLVPATILLGLIVLAGWFIADRPTQPEIADFSTAAAPAAPQAPSVLILPFENVSGDRQYDFVAKGITYELISSLTQFEDFAVYGAKTSFTTQDDTGFEADYLVSGSIQVSDDVMRVNALLTERASGRVLWAWNTRRGLSASGLIDTTVDIARYLVNVIAQPDGVILDALRDNIESAPANTLLSYECVTRFKINWRLTRSDDFDGIRQCLTNTIKSDPTYAQGFSSLALLNIDAYRFGFGSQPRSRQLIIDAMQLAQQAKRLDPRSSGAYLALSLAYWFSDDVDMSLRVAEQGLALNPNNTELTAELGLRYANLARWDKSVPLITRAFAREPAASSPYRMATFLYAYMHGDYRRSIEEALRIDTPAILYGHVALAAAYGQLGEDENAVASIAEILRIAPDYPQRIRKDLDSRHLDPEIIDAVIDGLRKAGLFS